MPSKAPKSDSSEIPTPQLGAELPTAPLFFAVTGHRDLLEDELPVLARSIREGFVRSLQSLGLAPSEAVLLSGLAEGADQLAAEVALDLRIPLVAVLPMGREHYESEFETSDGLECFRRLESSASCALVAPDPWPPLVDREDNKKNLRYHAHARYLAQTADVLIALWDGESAQPEEPGGTAHVVELFRHRARIDGGRLGSDALREVDPGVLVHCPAGRRCHGPHREVGRIRFESIPLLRGLNSNDAFATLRSLERLEPFRGGKVTCRLKIGNSGTDRSVTQLVGTAFARHDRLACHYRHRRDRLWMQLFIFAFLAALFAGLYSDCPLLSEDGTGNWRGWLWGYFVFLSTAYVIYLRKRGRFPFLPARFCDDPETAFEDHRVLAEGLRIQTYWHRVGIGECVANHYRAIHRPGLGWVVNALRARHLELMAGLSTESTGSPQLIERVREDWIEGQRAYFRERISGLPDRPGLEARIRTWRRVSTACLTAGLFLVIVNLCNSFVNFLGESVRWLSVFGMSFLPVVAGLLRYLLEATGIERIAERYRTMASVFSKAEDILDDPSVDSREVYFQLGVEALTEHGEWLLFHRTNEVAVPR